MTEETALVPVATENSPKELARAFAASGFFGDIHKISQALVKIAAGQELGLGPMASMTGIHLIEGEISLGANLLAALIRRSELYDYEILELTNRNCTIRFSRNGKALNPDSTFTLDDAQAAGILKPRSGWEKYPRNMLFARAISNGFRWHCPELGGGTPLYTPEDFGRITEGEFTEIDAATGEKARETTELAEDVEDPKDPAQDTETSKPPQVGEESKPEPSAVEDPIQGELMNGPEEVPAGIDIDEPLNLNLIREFLDERVKMHKGKRTNDDLVKQLAIMMGECLVNVENADADRHRILLWQWGVASTNDLRGSEIFASLDHLRLKEGKDGKLHPDAVAARELRAIATFMRTAA